MLNIDFSQNSLIYKDLYQHVLHIMVNPFSSGRSSKTLEGLSYEDTVFLHNEILPKIFPILSDLDEMNSKNLKKVFCRLIPTLLKVESRIRKFKREKILKLKNDKIIDSRSPDVLSRYKDGLSLAKIIHYFFAKNERRINFLKNKNSEIFSRSKLVEKFVSNYDIKYLDSIEFRSQLVVESEEMFFIIHQGWDVLRDLMLKMMAQYTTYPK